jgi:hypothetical protein
MRTAKPVIASVLAAVLALLFLGIAPAQAAPGETPSPTGPLVDSLAPDHAGLGVTVPEAAGAALATIQARVADYVATHGTGYSFADYVDPATGQVVLETDAPASLVAALTDLTGTATAEAAAAARQTLLRRVVTSDSVNRRDDAPPFRGGGGTTDGQFICSSGFAVRTTTGVVRMTTAGHCFANGTAVRTESGNRAYGTVSGRRLDSITHDRKDMELIGGRTYAGRIFTGGVVSNTSIPVVSAGTAVVGAGNYCHSGRTTGERCGHTVTSTNAQVCTESGCKQPVISYRGGVLQQGGDSGAPFYTKNSRGAFVRGHVIAGNSVTGYIEPWTVLRSTYNVTIVTG